MSEKFPDFEKKNYTENLYRKIKMMIQKKFYLKNLMKIELKIKLKIRRKF